MFRPTYPPSCIYKNIQTTWGINYITLIKKKKISFVHNQKYLPSYYYEMHLHAFRNNNCDSNLSKHLLENEYPIYTIDNTMENTVNHRKRFTSQQNKITLHLALELHLSGRCLSGSAWPFENLQNYLVLKLPVMGSSTIQFYGF
jgi:hypothetical protein